MATLFISDLHLSPERPAISRVFFDFLRGPARQAEALYILGDLFDYWAGDDDLADPFNLRTTEALAQLSGHGVGLYFLPGNRDLLIGEAWSRACRAHLLPDPSLVDLYGTPTLLLHGDTLCQEDAEYQVFRARVHDPEWQRQFLAKPLAERRAAITDLRSQSESEKRGKPAEIMDVTPAAVEAVLRQHGYPRLIHGHTHRPARHLHQVDGRSCERWVLSDWYQHGEYLRCDEGGCAMVRL